MKKLTCFVFILSIQFITAKAQYVTIPDAAFVTKLTQLYPSCMNGNQLDTTCSLIVNETEVYISNTNINNLSGIEYFDNLLILNCSYNQLSNIPLLPSSLTSFSCNGNLLTNLPLLPPNLIFLNCMENQISSIPTLPNLLNEFYCGDNLLTLIPPLPATLKLIWCHQNQLTNLPQLPDSLESLQCNLNQITGLPSLPNTLKSLICNNNPLNSLPVLPDSLEYLKCNTNQLSILPTLPNTIKTLVCGVNQLTVLPQLPDSLEALNCSNCLLTSLPSIPITLKTLYCNNNLLNSLPPIYRPAMKVLHIANNNISCLDYLPLVEDTSSYYYFNISNNPLSCVPNQTYYSLGLPLCVDNDPVNNPNSCPSANIIGSIYKDSDNDCINSSADFQIENMPVKLYDSQNNLLAQSYTINGVYSFSALLPDTFQIKVDDNAFPISISCGQLNNQTVILDSLNQTLTGINFAVDCDTANDILVQSLYVQNIVFPGLIHTLNTNIAINHHWFNLNCPTSNYSGNVSIDITGPVAYVSPGANALTPQVNGNNYFYNILDFNNISSTDFGLKFKTDTTAQAGDQICIHVDINPLPFDNDTINNTYDFCYNVVNSYDPNMKEVYPVNVSPGYDDWFTYTIHFQNTGNAPAFNIRLRDTLDANLDINSFEILGYSHPAQVSLSGNVLTVRFNNIMLPDSTFDYEGSMGYFQYRLKPLPNLINGTQIENTAYIYFDYNAPIITNTTQSNFNLTVGDQSTFVTKNDFILYPNPSNGIFNFKDTKNLKQVELYNIMGEPILLQGNQKQINLNGFAKGIYYARINGEVVLKLVKE
jgi:uncharacterized repeat protein (TIGR01451 family)